MKIKKRWIILIIVIELLVAISLWAGNKKQVYDGEYYSYKKSSIGSSDYYEYFGNENGAIIKSSSEFETYLKILESLIYHPETFEKLRKEFNDQFFYNNSLLMINLQGEYMERVNECRLLSVNTQGEKVNVDFKYCSSGIGYVDFGTDYIFFITINSKTVSIIDVNVSTTDIYEKISEICKNITALLIIATILYICIKLLYKKTGSKLKTAGKY